MSLAGRVDLIVRRLVEQDSTNEISRQFRFPLLLDPSDMSLGDLARRHHLHRLDSVEEVLELSHQCEQILKDAYGLSCEAYLETASIVGCHPFDYPCGATKVEVDLRAPLEEIVQESVRRDGGRRCVTVKSFYADRRVEVTAHVLQRSARDIIDVARKTASSDDIAAAGHARAMTSYAVGIAFHRWAQQRPPECSGEIDGLASLSNRSPAMTHRQGGSGSGAGEAQSDGILVHDKGYGTDIAARVVHLMGNVWPDLKQEDLVSALGEESLRAWINEDLFAYHASQYSKSRRKAPIYWQLATPSGSYSAWLYYHRFTRDTLARLLNDHVAPKLQHEERKLTNLTQDAGPNPTASQRKEIDAHEIFVGELRAFRDEVARVAPLWNPNLNDGVILNFAPLWRLVPQHKAWQKECKSAWDKLCEGDYDWAHLAMHLWPERVVPKCAKDRSLAIAHELEDVFWREDEDGKWQPKTVSEDEVAGLVAERTSPAVTASLKSLLEAPAPAPGRGRAPRRKKKATTRRAKATASSTVSAEPRERAPRQNTSARTADAAGLDEIRSAIATLGGNAAKSDILETAGLSASQWTPAINALLADGSVTKTGQKRGTRYHLAQDPS